MDRECIASQCKGCSRVIGMKWEGTGAYVQVCSTYPKPSIWWRNDGYCPFNPPKKEVEQKKVRVGQQKQKKRSR